MALKYIDQAELSGQRVLARFDFNVPLDKDDKTKIADTSRIDLAIPTIQYLIDHSASKITLMSHHGRPKGKVNLDYSLEPVAKYLALKLGVDVILSESAIDSGVKELLTLGQTKIVLLENLRFHPEEEENDEDFAAKLSQYGDVYINDAFGAAHREHASTHIINKFFQARSYGGFLMKKEIESLDRILKQPEKPFVAVVGGAKVSDKIKTIEKLIVTVDSLIIGGAMAYPFLKAKGYTIGISLCSDEDVALATKILKADKGFKIKLPNDHIISQSFSGKPQNCEDKNIPEGFMGLDIGPSSIAAFSAIINEAKTILWNGPMGIFENPNFANGTMSIAKSISDTNAFTLVGGGDSVNAVNKSGLADKFSHISTGGGASLEYIEKGELPGVKALRFGV